ncbi:SRPBCC family protein [Devosia sp. PTR5]|uniref:SRPBCC family protein n=1 Tax=Devosia oryzisoli TaxID=2774138 RepID=A0A927FRZ6_9HYPH|nr:SRPBCC family protein [Devosia oryzisoli]MBD8064347.1 SRPBCC family protein [Devosia oryzisoli]
MKTYNSRMVTITILRPWQEVYAFAADPANMTRWAAGLGNSFVRDGEFWVASDPGGNPIHVRFTPANAFGILDHDVHVGGEVVHVALRVMPNGDGSEVAFLLLQERGMDDQQFRRDAAAVRKDLETLKAILENDK